VTGWMAGAHGPYLARDRFRLLKVGGRLAIMTGETGTMPAALCCVAMSSYLVDPSGREQTEGAYGGGSEPKSPGGLTCIYNGE
jgi:hypothetical protein